MIAIRQFNCRLHLVGFAEPIDFLEVRKPPDRSTAANAAREHVHGHFRTASTLYMGTERTLHVQRGPGVFEMIHFRRSSRCTIKVAAVV